MDNMTLMGFTKGVNLTLIEEIQNKEFIIGFWANKKIEKIGDGDQFATDHTSKRLKVVWNFKIDDIHHGLILMSTETRIYCINLTTEILFGIYWAIIRPFSGLIRIRMLHLVKESAEFSEIVSS